MGAPDDDDGGDDLALLEQALNGRVRTRLALGRLDQLKSGVFSLLLNTRGLSMKSGFNLHADCAQKSSGVRVEQQLSLRHSTFQPTLTTCQPFDLIAGPQYWRLNKRWRLCTEGHKQSPVDIRTSQLVFDHLLPPIQLTWLPAGSNLAALEEEQQLHQAANKPPQQQQQPSQVSAGAADALFLIKVPASLDLHIR